MKHRILTAVAASALVTAGAEAAVPFRVVAANGDPAPGTTNGRFVRPTSASVSPSGKVAFVSQVEEVGAAPGGVWVETDAGLKLVARQGTPMPGVGTFDGFLGAPASYSGWVVFAAHSAGSVTVFTLDGVSLRPVVRAGATVDGETVGLLSGTLLATSFLTNAKGDTITLDDAGRVFSIPRTGAGTFVTGDVGSRPALSEQGHVAFVANASGDPTLRFGTPGAMVDLATVGQGGPGTVGDEVFDAFGAFDMGADGFLVAIAGASDPNTGEGWSGVFTKSPNGDLSLLQKLPLSAGPLTIQSVERVVVATGSIYLLRGTTAPDGVGEQKVALVARRGGGFVPIAVQGDPAPGVAGATYQEIGKAHVNADGGVFFAATLAGPTITAANATIVYVLPNANATAPEIVARAGTPIDLGGERGTVTPAVVNVPDNFGRGGPIAFNDAGEGVFAIRYSTETADANAVFVTGAPSGVEPSGTADLKISATHLLPHEEAEQDLPGDEFLIRVTVENVGGGTASPVRVDLVGEDGKAFNVVEGQGPWSCTASCSARELLPGERHEGLVRVSSAMPNTITLTASHGQTDPTPENNVTKVAILEPTSAQQIDKEDGTCGCRLPGSSPSRHGVLASAAFAALALLRRRRAR